MGVVGDQGAGGDQDEIPVRRQDRTINTISAAINTNNYDPWVPPTTTENISVKIQKAKLGQPFSGVKIDGVGVAQEGGGDTNAGPLSVSLF